MACPQVEYSRVSEYGCYRDARQRRLRGVGSQLATPLREPGDRLASIRGHRDARIEDERVAVHGFIDAEVYQPRFEGRLVLNGGLGRGAIVSAPEMPRSCICVVMNSASCCPLRVCMASWSFLEGWCSSPSWP